MLKSITIIASATILSLGLQSQSFAQVPSKSSVMKLLEVTESEKMINEVAEQMIPMSDQIFDSMQAESGHQLSAEQQKKLKELNTKVVKMIFDDLKWNTIKDDIAQIYTDSFTQEEVDGLIQFYQSPVGQSTLKKMPVIMNKTMQVTSERTMKIMPKIKAEVDKIMQE